MRSLSAIGCALVLCACSVAQEIRFPTVSVERAGSKPSGELAELLKRMSHACQRSAAVFEGLTVEQMNWRPPDGTHTPRWNAEHMTGRQLLFFSQIYATIDPQTHRALDLNPAQMPSDYEPANLQRSGEEEAAFMLRVNDYVLSFAYLMEGFDLDQKAPGSKWTLRGLLRQMERHFEEHTANVKKKFELPGWPGG